MPPPSQLAIATSVLNRLIKDETSYHKELEQQQASIAKLEKGSEDENAEYLLRQERKGVEETKAMFPQLREKIQNARARLEQQLEKTQSSGDETATDDITKAKEAIAASLTAERQTH